MLFLEPKKLFAWSKRYVVLCDGCMYSFSNETSKTENGSCSLYGYNSIYRAPDIPQCEALYAFKVVHSQQEYKTYVLSAASESEMKEWMKQIKLQMMRANNMSLIDGDKGSKQSTPSLRTYKEIEEDIYSPAQLSQLKLKTAPKGKPSVCDSEDDDKDSDGEDFYEDVSATHKRNLPPPAKQIQKSQTKPKHTSTVPQSYPKQRKEQGDSSDDDPHDYTNDLPIIPPTNKTASLPRKLFPHLAPPKKEEPKTDDGQEIYCYGDIDTPIPTHTAPRVPASRPLAPLPVLTNTQKSNSLPTAKSSRNGAEHDGPKAAPRKSSKPSVSDSPPDSPAPPLPRDVPSQRKVSSQNHAAVHDGSMFLGGGDEAGKLINDIAEEGVYLIRQGSKGWVLVVFAKNKTMKYKIEYEDKKYYMSANHQFDTITDLIQYYTLHRLPIGVRLVTPYKSHPKFAA